MDSQFEEIDKIDEFCSFTPFLYQVKLTVPIEKLCVELKEHLTEPCSCPSIMEEWSINTSRFTISERKKYGYMRKIIDVHGVYIYPLID